MYKVYKISSKLTEKIYFGYTKQRLKARFYGHHNEPRNTIISRSIRKYGKDNFLMDLILECDDENDAKFIEQFLIFRHKTNVKRFPDGNGMNMTDGGEGARGYTHSKELKEKWKRNRKGMNKGKKRKPEDTTRKKVYQFDTEGNFISIYKSAKEAADFNNTSGGNISKCCTGKSITCKGFIFQYNKQFIPRFLTKNKIVQMDKENNIIASYPNARIAAESTKLKHDTLRHCLSGRLKTYGGFIWRRQPHAEFPQDGQILQPSL
jgi:group I intron endonuclease